MHNFTKDIDKHIIPCSDNLVKLHHIGSKFLWTGVILIPSGSNCNIEKLIPV